jgi:hypothetical protein
MKKRAPFLPLDFNPRFFQAAHPELICPNYLQGGEPVELSGVTPTGPLRFHLPRCTISMIFHLDGQACAHTPNLDTLCFEPDEQRYWMIWRTCQVVDKKVHRLKELEVRCREFSAGGGRH